MARKSRKRRLTELSVASIKPPRKGRLDISDSVQRGLQLRVTDYGSKSWCVVVRLHGKTKRHTLGKYPDDFDLAAAREAARKYLSDPERHDGIVKRGDGITVNEAITEFIAYYKRKRRSWRQAQNRLERTAGKCWGHWPITDVKRSHVKAMRKDLLDDGKDRESNQVVTLLRVFFAWAEDEPEYIKESPAATVKAKGETKERDRVLSHDEIRALWRAARKLPPPWGPYVLILMLTAKRRTEISELRWSEVDSNAGLLSLAPERTKMGRDSETPLTQTAVDVLRAVPRIDGSDYVFSTGRGNVAISNFSHLKAKLEALAPELADWRFHDIRRAVTTEIMKMSSEEDDPRDRIPLHVIKALLDHSPKATMGVTSIYARWQYAPEQRDVLTRWEARLLKIVGEAPEAAQEAAS